MNKMLIRLINVYGHPESENPAAYLAEIEAAISGYPDDLQDAAASRIIRTYRGRSFPPPSVVVAACSDEAAARGALAAREPQRTAEPDWSKQDFAIADRLIRSAMGREAVEGGWIGALHDYCRNKHQLPGPHEKARLIREAREVDEAYAACCEGRAGLLSASLAELGRSFLHKRNVLAARVHGVPEPERPARLSCPTSPDPHAPVRVPRSYQRPAWDEAQKGWGNTEDGWRRHKS